MEKVTLEQVKEELMKLAKGGGNMDGRAERINALKVLADILLREQDK